jgi:hypothetical protein
MMKCKKLYVFNIYLQSEQREERVNPAHLAGMTCKLVCLPPAKPVLSTTADLWTTAEQSTASSSVTITSTEPTSPTTTQTTTTTESTSTTTIEAVVLETTTLKKDDEQERYISIM